MKNVVFPLMVFFLACSSLTAQVPDVNKAKESVAVKAGPGKLLNQLAGAIKPESFLSSWAGQKTSWLGKAGKITDAAGLAKGVSSLAGFIKPDMFKKGLDVNNLVKTANTAKTMSDATGLLKGLEGGLKPEALTSGWNSQRTGWLSALNMLK